MSHYRDLLSTLDRDAVILTPNRRLAMALHGEYTQLKIEDGQTCWQTPNIYPIQVWIDELWSSYTLQSFAETPTILNATQEQLLWESILSNPDYHAFILQISETARLVKSADNLLKQWQLTPDHPQFALSDDYSSSRIWLHAFAMRCKDNNWVTSASLPDMVREQIINGNIKTPSVIYHVGFNELTPQITALFTAATECGSCIQQVEPTQPAQRIQRITAHDRTEELRICAQWAKSLHQQFPHETIACVIPQLDKQRERVIQIFDEVFTNKDDYNISAGQPLSQFPVITAALQLLSLYKNQITADSFFFTLTTPFIAGGEKERIQRSKFDIHLRNKNVSHIHLKQLLDKEHGPSSAQFSKSCPQLAKRLLAFKVLLEDCEKSATYATWAELFNRLLSTLGWPGERILSSEEYQVVEQWLSILESLIALDHTMPPCSFYHALQTLNQIAAASPFQPKTPPARVQILGVLEAAGLCFDHLWISGLDDSSWPSQPSPNPFIPRKLQRDYKMPHASADRELSYCQSMTQQFKHSATNVIFSSARIDDENSLQPSPLIRDIPESPISEILPQADVSLSTKIFLQRSIESICDEQAPAIRQEETPQGGVKIIENQAKCPFKAFAESRLGARELDSALPGLRRKERGTIVHTILENIWLELQTWDRLTTTSNADLHQLLDTIIDAALLKHADAQKHQSSYLALEKLRLHKLIFNWLEQEKQRSPFTVQGSEVTKELVIGQLPITVRIDRVDLLPDGNKLIIDYKTGKNLNINEWFGERPEAPQLPLYTQIEPSSTAGIAYAQIRAGSLGFIGISQYALDIDGIDPAQDKKNLQDKNWQEITNEWRQTFHRLAAEFYQGDARVAPKNPKICDHCKLQSLCRVYEYGGQLHDE